MSFRVSRLARDRYRFDPSLFSEEGNAALRNFHQARLFAQQINAQRDLAQFPERSARAGQINAMALITRVLRHIFDLYVERANPAALPEALEWLGQRRGAGAVDTSLSRLTGDFPPAPVYARQTSPEAYLNGSDDGVSHREVMLEELVMLWLSNSNPAFLPYRELFDDTDLGRETDYQRIVAALTEFFAGQPSFPGRGQGLIDLLRAPALASPHSLSGQLEYILERWGPLLGSYLYQLLSSLDLIKEEEKLHFPAGPGPSLVRTFETLEGEAERFSPDEDWMPRVVVMAKNTYVWLDQLSRAYGRAINTLDQIPDEELDTLARRGFSGLWLIGLWERSPASQEIKRRCGNPDAVSSAYSLFDYRIADDLGGEPACESLRARAWARGIRLASDMVPNHMGIDSRWVIEHPDWFISLDYSPFPSYSFNGEDVIHDERVSIHLEDHYYDRSDAAVVFKRVDRWTGSEQYIYHGNDGTSMPWNDTAQLNYLKADVREAVIQTILHVARQFPVIRFDAAMTLAKKHYQRLWFPQPGNGGAIPSRAEHSLTREQFDALMPEEFWREVVDRVAVEAPGTLLLAEAFWMMEGYFVRTLGMHRVYNSAFMNMLRDEENAKYRSVIKNTVEFDPEILKRYVNFLNNPDESTAIAQFGKDDKYFGICMMMVTMPGLPMFGHGQLEGYAEKYGMEYRRAYWDEKPDDWLVARHEREISPLLHRRHVFAGVEQFLLYDCYAVEGHVLEDVFAYSNRSGDDRALVIFHNRFAEVQGWIRTSAAFMDKGRSDRGLVQKSLGEGLGLTPGHHRYCIFRDHASGLEFIRHAGEVCEKGLFVSLGAYKYQVFLDFREVEDNEWRHYALLAGRLDGRGVPSIHEALREILLQPILEPFAAVLHTALTTLMPVSAVAAGHAAPAKAAVKGANSVHEEILRLLTAVKEFTGGPGDAAALAAQLERELAAAGRQLAADQAHPGVASEPAAVGPLYCWIFAHSLGRVVQDQGFEQQSRSWIDEWLLGKAMTVALQEAGLDEGAARRGVVLVKLLTAHQHWYEDAGEEILPARVLETWLQDEDARLYLGVNRHGGQLWFNHESFEELLCWMAAIAQILISTEESLPSAEAERQLAQCAGVLQKLRAAEAASGYRVDRLLAGG